MLKLIGSLLVVGAIALGAGTAAAHTTPEEFAAFIQKEAKTWGDIVKAAGIQPS